MDPITFVALCMFGAGLSFGVAGAVLYGSGQRQKVQNEAVEFGLARFDSKTKKFKWLKPGR